MPQQSLGDREEEARPILIVDDNTFNVHSLRLIIEECFQIRCDVAYSGQEAIEKVSERPQQALYTLILTDINMPEMDGLQMSR